MLALLRAIRRSRLVIARASHQGSCGDADERESGLREILNFGHTLGHALETATRLSPLPAREAIGWGMIAATLFALATDRLRETDATRMIAFGCERWSAASAGGNSRRELRPIMAGDKKARGGRVLWVLPRRIGTAEWGVEIPWPLCRATFAELARAFPRNARN